MYNSNLDELKSQLDLLTKSLTETLGFGLVSQSENISELGLAIAYQTQFIEDLKGNKVDMPLPQINEKLALIEETILQGKAILTRE